MTVNGRHFEMFNAGVLALSEKQGIAIWWMFDPLNRCRPIAALGVS